GCDEDELAVPRTQDGLEQKAAGWALSRRGTESSLGGMKVSPRSGELARPLAVEREAAWHVGRACELTGWGLAGRGGTNLWQLRVPGGAAAGVGSFWWRRSACRRWSSSFCTCSSWWATTGTAPRWCPARLRWTPCSSRPFS